MKIKIITILVLLAISTIFISGCISQDPILVKNHELQSGEIANYDAVVGWSQPSFKQPLPEGAGIYHIYVSTINRGSHPAHVGYTYKFNERKSDKFGNYDQVYSYGWEIIASPNGAGYLGKTDDYSTVNTTFSIPDGVWEPKILINTLEEDTSTKVKVIITKIS